MFNQKRTCFIITPIGKSNSTIRRKIDGVIDEVINPVLKELGYQSDVSHRMNDSGLMTNAIIQKVYNSDLVIANLTGNNPNVMYEVALRHASAKPIIHITENLQELPFDISDQRAIEYTDDMSGAVQLKIELLEMIKNINFEEQVNNPITNALGKKDLVNIPSSSTVELGEVLGNIQDELRVIKKDIADVKSKKVRKNKPNTNARIPEVDSIPFDYMSPLTLFDILDEPNEDTKENI